ncbi:MAG: regulatory protein ArsR [archaeon GW2011_AR3]|nr:MAG: regulatory protein ArsR [archaeon GW2011_AR3]MBS3109730.1 winged helix-turn-helix transcriptional regulator [Candidatus Woesearchaeota archaeon]
MKHILLYLIAGTRGGETRARIINFLRKKPSNAHKLAKSLKLDYKTITHHLEILIDNKILGVTTQKKYGAVYYLDEFFEKEISTFDEIVAKFGQDLGKSN